RARARIDDQRTRMEAMVDQELTRTTPPEIVHGDHHPRATVGRGGDEIAAERLQAVQVHDVGTYRTEPSSKVRRDGRIPPVPIVGPANERRADDPSDGQTRLVRLGPGLERLARSVVIEPSGVDVDVVPPSSQATRQSLGNQRSTAHEVGWVVTGNNDDSHW